MYRLQYLPLVKQDMIELVRHRSSVSDSMTEIETLSLHIVKAAESLKKFPYIGVKVYPDIMLRREYRVLLVRKYMLFFTIDDEQQTVTVARLLYGWRKYEKLLK